MALRAAAGARVSAAVEDEEAEHVTQIVGDEIGTGGSRRPAARAAATPVALSSTATTLAGGNPRSAHPAR
jgi:hypothetical protein